MARGLGLVFFDQADLCRGASHVEGQHLAFAEARRDLRRFKQLMETGEIATPAMNRRQFEEMGL